MAANLTKLEDLEITDLVATINNVNFDGGICLDDFQKICTSLINSSFALSHDVNWLALENVEYDDDEIKDDDPVELRQMKMIIVEALKLLKMVKKCCFRELDRSLVDYYLDAREIKQRLIINTLRILRMYRMTVGKVDWSQFLSEFFGSWLSLYTKQIYKYRRKDSLIKHLGEGASQDLVNLHVHRHEQAWANEEVGLPFYVPKGFNGWTAKKIDKLNKKLPKPIEMLNQRNVKNLQRKRTEMELLLTVMISNEYARRIIDGEEVGFDCGDADENPISMFYRNIQNNRNNANLNKLADDARFIIKKHRDCNIATLNSIVASMLPPATPPRLAASAGHGSTTPPRLVVSSGHGSATPPRLVVSSGHGSTTPPRLAASAVHGSTTPPRLVVSSSHGSTTPPRLAASAVHGSTTPPRLAVSSGHGSTTPPSPPQHPADASGTSGAVRIVTPPNCQIHEAEELEDNSFILVGDSAKMMLLCRNKPLRPKQNWCLPHGIIIRADVNNAVPWTLFIRLNEEFILVPRDYFSAEVSTERSFELCSDSLFFHAEMVDFADRHLAHLESNIDGIRCIKAAAPFEPLKMVCNVPDSRLVKDRRAYRKVLSLLQFLWRSCLSQCDAASADFLASHPVVKYNMRAMNLILKAIQCRVATLRGLKKHKFEWFTPTEQVSVDDCQFIVRSVVAFVEEDTHTLASLTPKYRLSVENRLAEVPFPWTMLLYTSVHRVFACHEDPRGVLQFLKDKWPQRANEMIARGVFYKPGPEAMRSCGISLGSDGEYFGTIPTDLDLVTPEAQAEPSAKTKRDDRKNTPNKRLKLPPSPQFLNAYGSNEKSGEREAEVVEADEDEETEDEETEDEETENEDEETMRQFLNNEEDDNDSTDNYRDEVYDRNHLEFDEMSTSDAE